MSNQSGITRVASPVSEVSIGANSNNSTRRGDTVKIVVTAPPWARHEPPSPTASTGNVNLLVSPTDDTTRPSAAGSASNITSDVASLSSSTTPPPGSHWWTFTLPRRKDSTDGNRPSAMKERSNSLRPPWTWDRPHSQHDEHGAGPSNQKKLSLKLPDPSAPFTLAQAKTPGWERPWAPGPPPDDTRMSEDDPYRGMSEDTTSRLHTGMDHYEKPEIRKWKARRKTCRSFCLQNIYVPLVFRILNLSFTAATLALGVKIRRTESRYGILGAVGSSPTLAIIFAPLTLVHVMIAIYLEYFGRPLGLWRTSAKLTHTLLEVVFICAWSASLSLSFDNYFTSVLNCTPPSATSWWSSLPPPPPPPGLGDGSIESSVANFICDEQLALICLVALGLGLYCSNLIISLFRIIEKVKYTTHNPRV